MSWEDLGKIALDMIHKNETHHQEIRNKLLNEYIENERRPKMRKQLYKVDLRMSNGAKLPIVVATCYIERLPEIIRNNKKYYDRPEYHVEGWNLVESCPTIQLSEHQYEEELTYVDIQDEEE